MAKPKTLPPRELLLEYFEFHDDGRVFVKKRLSCRSRQIGEQVGTLRRTNRYLAIDVEGERFQLHRLIFYVFNGWCPDQIDHIDGNRLNNAPANLRPANSTQNLANAPKQSYRIGQIPSSPYKGVSWHRRASKWMAMIHLNRQHIYLGLFGKEEDAHAAYCQAAKKYFGEFARTI